MVWNRASAMGLRQKRSVLLSQRVVPIARMAAAAAIGKMTLHRLREVDVADGGSAAGGEEGIEAVPFPFACAEGFRLRVQASNSEREAETEPILSWRWRWTGIPSRFSQRWTVVTSRLRYAAISFQESSRSSRGLSDGDVPRDGSPIAVSCLVRDRDEPGTKL